MQHIGASPGKQKCGLQYVKTAIFYRAMLCISAVCAVMRCLSVRPSVCLSVCLSVMFVDHVKTNKHMFEFFSPSGSHTILVYWSYTDTKHRTASLWQQSFLLNLLSTLCLKLNQKRHFGLVYQLNFACKWKHNTKSVKIVHAWHSPIYDELFGHKIFDIRSKM